MGNATAPNRAGLRQAVLELWPELDWIADPSLRDQVTRTWERAFEVSPLAPGDLREIPFIHTVPQTWNRMALPSMFGGGTAPLESFGWQLDDLEIWDGLPAAERRAESRPR